MTMQFFDYEGYDLERYKYPKTADDVFTFVESELSRNRPCGDIEKRGKLDTGLISQLLSKDFSSLSSMKAVECMIDNSTFLAQLSRSVRSRIGPQQKNFKKGKHLSSGTYGETFVVNILGTNVEFACKTPLDVDLDSLKNFMVEYFIGAAVLNKLRKFCPTFCYTIGTFECGGSKKPDELCGTLNPKPHVLMEYIKGTTMGDVIGEGDLQTFVSCLIQLLLALEIAQREARFCHYDLSYNNVMVTSESKNFSIALDDKVYNFGSKRAVIIDYGLSSVTYKGKIISNNHLPNLDRRYNKRAFLVQGVDILYFLSSIITYIEPKNRIRKYIETLFPSLFYGLFDPYKLYAVKGKRSHIFEREYVGKYATSKLAQVSPGMVLDKILRDKHTISLIGSKLTIVDRQKLDDAKPVYEALDKIYNIKAMPRNIDCLPELTSYMLVEEAIQDLKLSPNKELRDKLIQYQRIKEDELKKADDEMLGNFFRMNINTGILTEIVKILDITLDAQIQGDRLSAFLDNSVFLQYIEYYLQIYYLIYTLGLQNIAPYNKFVSAFKVSDGFRFFKTNGNRILAARRWVYTLFDNQNIKPKVISGRVLDEIKKQIAPGMCGTFEPMKEDNSFLEPKNIKTGCVMSDVIFIISKDVFPSANNIVQSMVELPFKVLLIIARDGIWQLRANGRTSDQNMIAHMKADVRRILDEIQARPLNDASFNELITKVQNMFSQFGLLITFTKTPLVGRYLLMV